MLTGDCVGISNIDIILGAEASYCTPVNSLVIGSESPSILSQTPYGVLLEGSLHSLCKNLSAMCTSNNYCNVVTNLPKPVDNNVSVKNCKPDDKDINLIEAESFSDSHDVTHREVSEEQNLPNDESSRCGNSFLPYSSCHSNVKFVSTYYELDGTTGVSDSLLDKAGKQILNDVCSQVLKSSDIVYEDSVALNDELTKFALNNVKRLEDGRIQMPLLWNGKVCHNLGKNCKLAENILKSNYRKLCKNPGYLEMTDEVFKEQEKLGIIEKNC